jgi:hypothetical protein
MSDTSIQQDAQTYYCHVFMVVTTSNTKMSRVRGSVTYNNGFWIG